MLHGLSSIFEACAVAPFVFDLGYAVAPAAPFDVLCACRRSFFTLCVGCYVRFFEDRWLQYGDVRCMFCDAYQGHWDDWTLNPYGEDANITGEHHYRPWSVVGKGGHRYRPMGKDSTYYYGAAGGKGGDRCRVAGFTFCSRHSYWHGEDDCYLYPVHFRICR